jgi:hypothetical protein
MIESRFVPRLGRSVILLHPRQRPALIHAVQNGILALTSADADFRGDRLDGFPQAPSVPWDPAWNGHCR